MNMANSESRSGRRARWMRVVLILSLGANLLVAGLFAGAHVRGWSKDEDGLSRYPAMFVRLLPDERQEDGRALLLSVKGEEDSIRARMSAVHGDIIDAIGAEPFAREQLAAAWAERRQLDGEIRALWHRQAEEMVARLTPDERQALAGKFERVARRWAEHHARK